MRRVGLLLIIVALVAGCDDKETPTGPSNSGPIIFTSQLSAANEVPPVSNAEANGRGNVTITFNVPRDSAGAVTGDGPVTFAVQANAFPAGTVVILGHIHPGAAGVNGSPLVNTNLSAASPLVMSDGTLNVTLTAQVTQAQAQQIVAAPSNFYFNLHTQNNTGGALRGQLTRTQ